MKNFEYAQPRTEAEAVQLLAAPNLRCAVLAGGTDLVGLMKSGVETPDRVVNISDVDSLKLIQRDEDENTWIGAAVSLREFADDAMAKRFPSITQMIDGISSIQLQSQGTVVGELLRRPTCWYYRNGQGLLADEGKSVVQGDNRYHAILGNRGPAKFVNASRLAPALIALGAYVRVVGPQVDHEEFLDLEQLYQVPEDMDAIENVLQPGQLVTHIVIPKSTWTNTASYEIRHGEGPDQPLASASVAFRAEAGRIQEARVVLGHVAPRPWSAVDASRFLEGQRPDAATAERAGAESVSGAMHLSHNEYKIQLASVAVKRAILTAAELETGGMEKPACGRATLAEA